MSTKELGTEIGQICAEGTTFLYEAVGVKLTVTDELKQKLDEGRKQIFGKLIPKVKVLETLNEEDLELCRQQAGITYAEQLPELMEMAERLENAFEEIEDMSDEDFIKNLQSLYMILSFLDIEELKESAPFIIEHTNY